MKFISGFLLVIFLILFINSILAAQDYFGKILAATFGNGVYRYNPLSKIREAPNTGITNLDIIKSQGMQIIKSS